MKALVFCLLVSIAVTSSHSHAAHHKSANAGGDLPVTKAEQDALTPESVLEDLMEGNKRFVSGHLPSYDVASNLKVATKGQFPKAYVLSCVDSRVPVEHVFNQGIGDIFVGRVAGNVENEDQLGSMEFATKYSGVKVVLVLGHEACGAVKGAIGGVEDGNLTLLLEKISPAIARAHSSSAGGSASDSAYVANVVTENVRKTVADLRARSAILASLENEGKIKIVGGVYSLETGKVTFL